MSFREHLALLINERLIDVWDRVSIPPGTDLFAEINHSLNRADIVVPLLSSSYHISRHFRDVHQRLEQWERSRATAVIPILIRPFDSGPLSPWERLQCLPRDRRPITTTPNQDAAWTQVTQEIRQIVLALSR